MMFAAASFSIEPPLDIGLAIGVQAVLKQLE